MFYKLIIKSICPVYLFSLCIEFLFLSLILVKSADHITNKLQFLTLNPNSYNISGLDKLDKLNLLTEKEVTSQCREPSILIGSHAALGLLLQIKQLPLGF